MTEENKAVTEAELDEMERRLRALFILDEVGSHNPLGEQAADALAALRRELDEAQERYAISQSVAGDMASALDDARSDIAKKDAALRMARRLVGGMTGDVIEAALAPAAQGETGSIYVGGVKVGEMEVPPIAPAPSAGETRVAIIEECAKAIEPKYPRPCDCERCDCQNYGDAANVAAWDEAASLVAVIRALAAAPTTGEPT